MKRKKPSKAPHTNLKGRRRHPGKSSMPGIIFRSAGSSDPVRRPGSRTRFKTRPGRSRRRFRGGAWGAKHFKGSGERKPANGRKGLYPSGTDLTETMGILPEQLDSGRGTPSEIGGEGDLVQQDVPVIGEEQLEERYRAGLREGFFEGGEGEVSRLLPPNTILRGYSVRDLIAAGLSQVPPGAMIPLIPPEGVAHKLQNALLSGCPLSLVRLGDGELLTLAHDTVIPAEEARSRGPFLPYAGVELPDYGARDALAQALRKADLIGVPESRHPSFQGLLFPVLSHYGLDPLKLQLTSSTVNYALFERGLLLPLLQGRRILIVGNKAAGLADVLGRSGLIIGGIVPSVQGAHDVENALAAAAGCQFDLALVSAGIAAVMICSEISTRLGKTAIDFGHMANKLESGEMMLH